MFPQTNKGGEMWVMMPIVDGKDHAEKLSLISGFPLKRPVVRADFPRCFKRPIVLPILVLENERYQQAEEANHVKHV